MRLFLSFYSTHLPEDEYPENLRISPFSREKIRAFLLLDCLIVVVTFESKLFIVIVLFLVLLTHAPMGGGPSASSGSSTTVSGGLPTECYKQAREEFDARYASQTTFQFVYRDFQILRPLGRGAFGSVKEVKCVRDPLPEFLQVTNPTDSTIKCQRIALKIINKKSAHKMKQEEHVVNEKRILQALNFPFIIRFYFSFKDNANLYIGLELIEGGELFRHLRDSERFDEKKSKFYASQILLALEYLHLLGIVYRDLKVCQSVLFLPRAVRSDLPLLLA